jgi:hypothetical protein
MQASTAARNGALDAIETAIGASPVLRILTGTIPADCSTAQSGTVLAEPTVPADAFAAASGGSKAGNSFPWTDSSANATGKAGYVRMYASNGTTCHLQGLAGQTWLASTAYTVGDQVNNGGNCYICDTSGTSAGSGGPTGTGSNITDGTTQWDYLGVAFATLDNVNIAVTQEVNVTAFTISIGGA